MKLIRKENGDYHLLINDEIKSLKEFNITKEDCDILTLGYSVEKMTVDFCDNIVKPKDETRSFYFAYNQGFKAHQELVKDKLLITDKDLFNFLYFARTHSQYSDGAIVQEFINKFLKEQTEWDVKFNEQGKLVML
jgi:phage regulator Rha-like protein